MRETEEVLPKEVAKVFKRAGEVVRKAFEKRHNLEEVVRVLFESGMGGLVGLGPKLVRHAFCLSVERN